MRGRYTCCALWTEVQACALPICSWHGQATSRPSPHLTPKSSARPIQPAILRAELPCTTAARTTPCLGVSRRCACRWMIRPVRLGRGSVEGTVPWTQFEGTPAMQNLVILAGNVGATPEARTTQGGTRITHFSLATSRPKRDSNGKILRDANNRRLEDTEWHRITCFNGVGKTVEQRSEEHTSELQSLMRIT